MKKYKEVPSFDELIEPCFNALKKLGGSGSNDEIYEQVIKDLHLTEDILSIMQTENGGRTKVAYNLAWAKTYLKKYGAINNPTRCLWEISTNYKQKDIKKEEVVEYKNTWTTANIDTPLLTKEENISLDDIPEENKPWVEELLSVLMQMNPYSFENLAQLLLRKMGVDDVVVTKKSNDGGIDGYGTFKLNGVISFRLAFQCKRYKGTVSASEIRNFRGSVTSDVEKYLFITTGTFTQEAKKEAALLGKPRIDLLDGDNLVEKLIDLEIGVKETKTYIVDRTFFMNI